MEYVDKKTGQVIITDSLLSGDWEQVEPKTPKKKATKSKE